MEQAHAPAYRLVRPPADGPGGAPGRGAAGRGGPRRRPSSCRRWPARTGKTTTIVAAVADRIERRGLDPERVLVLTFSRKAAAELRERITARLRRTTREPLAMTFPRTSGRVSQGVRLAVELLANRQARLGDPAHADVAEARMVLGQALLAAGHPVAARRHLEEAADTRRGRFLAASYRVQEHLLGCA